MKAFYVFQAQGAPDIRCITDDASGGKLPAEHGPWTLTEQVNAEGDWPLPVNRKVVAFGITENGYYLWGTLKEAPSSKPIIESDRVEGTAVFDPKKRSGRDNQAAPHREGEWPCAVCRCDLRRFSRHRGPSPDHTVGKAHICSPPRWLSDRHHCGAGQRRPGVLWRRPNLARSETRASDARLLESSALKSGAA